MSWFDALLLLILGAIFLHEIRQEAGRGLMDALATLIAAHGAAPAAAWLTAALGWKALPGTDSAPLLYGLAFLGLWAGGLAVSFYAHRHTRWSMDNFDLLFGAA